MTSDPRRDAVRAVRPDAAGVARPHAAPTAQPDATRAARPDTSGYVERDGARVYWEAFGSGSPSILLLPSWSIVHSRIWKGQVPYLGRRYRVVTFDGVGNGRSDRPRGAARYAERAFKDDALAVLDATGTDRAVVVSLSKGAQRALALASDHPDRVIGNVFICPAVDLGTGPHRGDFPFHEELEADGGWARYNAAYWRRDFRGFAEFFFGRMFTEPHSTKPIEDSIGWAMEGSVEALIDGEDAAPVSGAEVLEIARKVRSPSLVIQGTDDDITGRSRGEALASTLRAELVLLEGSGHGPHARDPVKVNRLIAGFVDSLGPIGTRTAAPAHPDSTAPRADGSSDRAAHAATWTRALVRPRRVLYLSSPIGLGHAQRDAAIADELRVLRPDVRIDWLAQHPVTLLLDARHETIHPASRFLASESSLFAAESSEHDLNAFQAIRRMDEILVANFMVFQEAVEAGDYDLVIGDESWDVDHHLHENPELKRTAFAWMTDFVGWLPMPTGGDREALLTADYNAEMIEHVARLPRIRDRAIFVGDPEDIVPDSFGPGLPRIRDWTEDHYAFSGYVTGFDPAPLMAEREELQAHFGYGEDEHVVIVTVGGSGVGESLLRRVIAAYPDAARRLPGLRMIAVAGPRIDIGSLPASAGVEVRAYVPDLYRHLAACDLAVVQGGLTTTMELTATRRPFLYFPLREHFEQSRHVRHRLDRHRAGRCMDYTTSTPEVIAAAIVEEINRAVDYRPVAAGGARRAAALLADLL